MSINTFKPLFVLFFLLSVFTTNAQMAAGRISGQVLTEDGKPAAGVTVELIETGEQKVAGATGKFSFSGLEPDTYTVSVSLVGYAEVQQPVRVTRGRPAKITLRLQISATSLEEVVVKGFQNSVDRASSSLRLQTPVIESPQNIQVIDKSILADQQVISMSDGVIRNVSGATRVEHWGDLYTNITARGSQIKAFRNGFNVVASYWGPLTEDMSMVERVEFVKGPAGFMLANGDPSGLYNVVTKKPSGTTKGELNFTLGSFDLYRGSLDLDGALSKDKKLLYRLNLAAQNKGSHRDHEFNNRYVIAPVISYQLDDKTKLTLEYNGQFARMTEVGSYYVFSREGYGIYPRNFTYTNPGLPPTKINDHSGYLLFEHHINDNWKLTAQGSYFRYDQEGMSSWPSYLAPQGDSLIRNIGLWDAKSTMALGQVFLNGEFHTGKLRHRILTGIDMGNKNYYADWGQSHDLDLPGSMFDPRSPSYGIPVNGYPEFDREAPIEERAINAWGVQQQRYSSIYLQDELAFFQEKLRLTLAGRFTDVRQVYGVDVAFDKAKHFTPRLGLSYSFDDAFSAYFLYDQAFVPQSGRLRSGGTIQPITGSNLELGLKKNWFDDQWSTTLSVYRILKQNELTADPSSSPAENYSIVLGEKVARGVEFDARGTILPGFKAVANYAFTESLVTAVTEGVTEVTVGAIVPGYAKHTTNAWLSYELQRGPLQGLGFSGGFTSLIDRYTGWSPIGKPLPDYFKLDGGLSYAKNQYRITFNVFNILDRYLYTGSYYEIPTVMGDWDSGAAAYYYQTEPPRQLRLSVSYRF